MRRSSVALWALMGGGAALAVASSLMPGRHSQVEASVSAALNELPPAKETTPAGPTLAASARDSLLDALTGPSPRLRFLAALALSRVRHPAAEAELARVLAEDPSVLWRLEAAYALARAGRPEGLSTLVEALGARRRNVRLEAARSLASLGDPRGAKVLRAAMELNSMRLGAAEALAVLKDPGALAVLRSVLASGSQENRLRAAAALGRLGDPSGIELLRSIVAAGQVDLAGASALMLLGDEAGRPALEVALTRTALRVPAALALRLANATPDLTGLASVIAEGDELARMTAAEAMLILADADSACETL